jgi:hypothetical protein
MPQMWLADSHFETNGPAPLHGLFDAGVGPLFTVRVCVIGGPVLGLIRLDGRMEGIRSELDLEVEGVV